MLFRTVYGLELDAIYQLIWNCNQTNLFPTKDELCRLVLPGIVDKAIQTTQPVEDALSFLHSAGMIADGETVQACFDLSQKSFQLLLLKQLIQIRKGLIAPVHPLDPLFIQLLDELYIAPDNLYIANVHQEANRLKAVQDAGGISKEKVQAWKRVLEFLGIGLRIQSGFLCTYTPVIIQTIINDWTEENGGLQDFLENHFSNYLPYCTRAGEIAQAVALPFNILEKDGFVELVPLQDSPARFYFGDRKLRGIARKLQP